MTHKHTAGPWYVDKGCGLYGCVYGGGLDAPNKLVANCEPEIHKETHTMNEISANAHLIAAAPELLDALETLAAYANGRLGANPYLIPEYKQALLAIAKARGMSPSSWMDANNEAYAKEAAKREGHQ